MITNLIRETIEITTSPEMVEYAIENAYKKDRMNKHTLREGSRTKIDGLLSEIAVHKFILPMTKHEPTDDYDLIFQNDSIRLTIDVKNKWDVKTYGRRPGLDWDCTIFGYEADKKCDLYLFTSINEDRSKIWVKGFTRKGRFVIPSRLYPAGSFRRTTQGSVQYEKDNYVIQVKELTTVLDLQATLRRALTGQDNSVNL